MTAVVQAAPNPYVGPRAFQPGEPLYGRDHEVQELLDLLLAERIVLLHSPSGAGKSSLVQAALIGRLAEEGFEVLPVVRVNVEQPPGTVPLPGHNRYVLSVLMSLEQDRSSHAQLDGTELAARSLDSYLAERPSTADNRVLIFDQFEEVLLDLADHAAKREFFQQLGSALRSRERWALFLVRDDYVAALDPYLRTLPTRARTRFRLDFLSQHAAREAVQCPVEERGVTFTDGAVNKLIDDLRQVWVQQPDGSSQPKPGPFVEPVQLQVVCLRLWDRLDPGRTEIHESDIESAGTVDTALSTYYAQQVAEVARRTGTGERAIRDWFGLQLIVEQRFRGQSRQGPSDGPHGGREVLRLLQDAHLIRAEHRLGTTWYELAHDRLVAPVQDDNTRWRQLHLHALQRQAMIWGDENRPEGLLLGAGELAEAEAWASANSHSLTRLDRDFLDACRRRGSREKRRRQLNRVLIAVTVAAVLLACATVGISIRAEREARTSDAAALMARAQADLDVDPRQGVQDALDALDTSPDGMTPGIRDVLYRAVDTTRVRGTLSDPGATRPEIGDMALSPDGSQLAAAGWDGHVRVWDLSTRQLRQNLPVNNDVGVGRVAFGDRNRIAVSEYDTAQLWDAAANQALRRVKHGAPITDVALDPGAGRMATIGVDGTIKTWESDTGWLLLTIPLGAGAEGSSVTFDGDGRRLATGDNDGVVTLWDSTTGQRIRDFTGHTQAVESVRFSPDGTHMVTGSNDSSARIWDVAGGQLLRTLTGHTNSVFWAGFTGDAARVATTSSDGTARIWDTASGTLLETLTGHTNPVSGGAFDDSGSTLYTASWDGSIKIWDATVMHTDSVLGLAFQPGAGGLLATGSADRTAKLWDVAPVAAPACGGIAGGGQTPRHTLRGHEDWVGALAFSPNGTLLATTSSDKSVKLWEVASGRLIGTLAGHANGVNGLGWNAQGTLLATAATGEIIIWEIPSGRIVRRLDVADQTQVNSVSFNHDATLLAAADGYGNVTFWDVTSGEGVYDTPHTKYVFKVVYDPRPGSTLLATASVDRTAKLLDAANGEVRHELRHDNTVSDVAFSPDGRRVATGSWDRTVKLWDADTGAPLLTITHAAQVVSVAFGGPNGRLLATTTSDHAVHVYDLDDSNLLALARCRAAAG